MLEWYLMTNNSRPNEIGGFENDVFLEHKDDSFEEVLSTDVATTVKLYTSNLSEFKEIRCIIQDNLSSTQLKSIERTILATIGTLKAGMYIYFENNYWLISGYPGNNGIYEKATAILCQYELKWQDDDGRIITRPANFTSASKYDVGENGNYTIILSSNNFTIWIPDDDDAFTLDGKRVFIDRAKKNPKKVFKITRSDDVLYLFGEDHGGILSFIADKTELNLDTDNQELRICDYKEPLTQDETEPPATSVVATITGGNQLRCGRAKTWSVQFKDISDEEISNCNFVWQISNIDHSSILQHISENKIQLKTMNDSLIGESFLLSVLIDGSLISEIEINIIENF